MRDISLRLTLCARRCNVRPLMKDTEIFDRRVQELSKASQRWKSAAKEQVDASWSVGHAARLMRGKKKISLRECARRMDVSAAYLSDLERGNRTWTDKAVEAFRKAVEQ